MNTRWYINDLSLQGQFADAPLIDMLRALMVLRMNNPALRDRLFCTRSLFAQKAAGNRSFQQLIASHPDRNLKSQVLRWVANSGPFWDDEQENNKNDYFEYQSHDVTEQGLGEAARRQLLGQNAHAFSFPGGHLSFTHSPLTVVQRGLSKKLLGDVPIPNLHDISSLQQAWKRETPPPNSWQTLLQRARQTFTHLIFSDNAMELLLHHPFRSCSAERIDILLGVLNRLCEESPSGQLTKRGQELLNQYFVGAKAKFTDESLTNQQTFKEQMTFPDPVSPRAPPLFCSWHGKVNYDPPLRIHFQWPRPAGEQGIKVVYIGPKITRD